jgi:AraC-like DNA-binding protein/quercetin dioxygenase-like cupin family protein
MSKRRRDARDREPDVRALASRYPAGFTLDRHAHRWAQLLYASEGVMLVETEAGTWAVPPQRAVWIPASVEHRIVMSGDVAMRTLYFSVRVQAPLGTTCVVNVSPLLRELVVHCARLGKLDLGVAHEERLARLVLDLLAEVATVPLDLPMPRDARALRLAHPLREDPAQASLPLLARRAGASPRTLERLFLAETGLTLAKWRQQARLLRAVALLAAKKPVTEVALEVGYASPSAFIAMFRAALGTTPSRFFG